MLIQSHLSLELPSLPDPGPANLRSIALPKPGAWRWMVGWRSEYGIGLAQYGFRFVFWLGLSRQV